MLGQDEIHIIQIYLRDGTGGIANHIVEKLPFGILQFEDLLLNRVFCDKADRVDGPRLADSVGSVGRLVLDHRIPPLVEVDDGVGPLKIQAEAARFEAQQEDGYAFVAVEPIDANLPVTCGVIYQLERDPRAVKPFREHIYYASELAEK